jgi:hypothetical protein
MPGEIQLSPPAQERRVALDADVEADAAPEGEELVKPKSSYSAKFLIVRLNRRRLAALRSKASDWEFLSPGSRRLRLHHLYAPHLSLHEASQVPDAHDRCALGRLWGRARRSPLAS